MGHLLSTADSSFHKAIYQLWGSPLEQKNYLREAAFEEAARMIGEKKGLELLYGYASILESSGLFTGTVWEDVKGLNPTLTRGTLLAGGSMAAAETLSNFRILALADGLSINPDMTSKEAGEYLEKLLALNSDLLAEDDTWNKQQRRKGQNDCAGLVMRFLASHCFSPEVFDLLENDLTNLVAQRPLEVSDVISKVKSASKLAEGDVRRYPMLHACQRALYFPSELARRQGNYLQEIKEAGDLVLLTEASQLRDAMMETGIVSSYHPIFLEYIVKEKPYLLEAFFGKTAGARAALKKNFSLICKMTELVSVEETNSCLYGLYCMFDRQLFTAEVVHALEEIFSDQLTMCSPFGKNDSGNVKKEILAGLISILGHPLGVAQGFNPTCQSTRLLSYLAQKYPHKLIRLAQDLLTSGEIVMKFEGEIIPSSTLKCSELKDVIHIDSLSVWMLPHLDAIYGEMLKRAARRGADPHKWVNSQFYMKDVLPGFAERGKSNEEEFVDLFHQYYFPGKGSTASHLPQPAGIVIFDRNGRQLGPHAILIQRVEANQDGEIRVYYYNPNNDSHQHWYNGIFASVKDYGELHGEASLEFDDFIKCLYAFHFPEAVKP